MPVRPCPPDASQRLWGFAGLFKDAKSAGMTEARYERYLAERKRAAARAVEVLRKDDINNEIEERKRELIKEFTDEQSAEPQNQVYATLADLGEGPNKLDAKALAALARDLNMELADLPRALNETPIYRGDGMDPETYAELHGFADAPAMLRAFTEAMPFDEYAERQVDKQLEEQGLAMSAERQAMYAVLNNNYLRVVQDELNALRAQAGEKRVSAGQIAAYVNAQMKKDRLREMTPRQYEAIARRKDAIASEGVQAGDFVTASVAKFQQRIALERAKALLVVQRNMMKDKRLVSSIQRHRRQHPRIPIEYLQALRTYMDALAKTQGKGLRLFTLADAPLTTDVLSGQPIDLKEFGPRELGTNIDFKVPPAHEMGWTYGDYQDVMNIVRKVYRRGEQAKQLLREPVLIGGTEKRIEALDNVVGDLVDRVKALPKRPLHNPTLWQRAKKFGERAGYFALKPETLAMQLDGFTAEGRPKPDGFHYWLIDGYFKAMTSGYADQDYTVGFETRYFGMQKDIKEMVDAHFPNAAQGAINKPIRIEGAEPGKDVPERMTHDNVVAVLLNLGNEENKRALRDSGYFTDAGIAAIMRHASKSDWDFAQKVWDYYESMWEDVAASVIYREDRIPVKVTPTPIEIDGRRYRGGYYPIIYDRKVAVLNVAEIDELQQRTRMGDFVSGMTDRGHTLERSRGLNHPISLSMSNIQFHLRNVAYDLELGDFTNDAWKILYNQELVDAFNTQGQADSLKALQLWLMDVTAGELHFSDVVNKFARWIRSGFTVSAIGANLRVATLQLTGVGHTITQVSAGSLAKVFSKQATHRTGSWFSYPSTVSSFMKQREHSWNAEAQLLQHQLSASWKRASAAGRLFDAYSGKWAMYPMMKMQKLVDYTTWYAALQDGMRIHNNYQEAAISHADRVVSESQGSAIFGLRSNLERGTINPTVRNQDIIRTVAPFISYFMAKTNLAYRKIRGTRKTPLGILNTLGSLMYLFWFEAAIIALTSAVFGRGEKGDEPIDYAKRAALEGVETMTAGIPLAREFTQEIKGFRAGGAIGAFVKDVGAVGQQIGQGELDAAFIKSAARLGGIVLKIPGTSQAIKTGDALLNGPEDLGWDEVDKYVNAAYGTPYLQKR